MKELIKFLKTIPVDLGQQKMSKRTKGKKIALGLVESLNGRYALDIGCREGEQSKCLISKGYSVRSIDLDLIYENAEFVDMNKGLPFKDSSFDLIWCSEVIEHLDDPIFAVSEIKRVLKPNGIFIITTPNSYMLFFRLIALFGFTPKKIQRDDHKHFFSYQDIKELFPDADVYGYFPWFLLKFKVKGLINTGALSPTFVIKGNKYIGSDGKN